MHRPLSVVFKKIVSAARASIRHRTFQTRPDPYATYLEICARDRSLESGRNLHAHLLVNGLARSAHLSSKLINFYTRCGHLSAARRLFDEMSKTNLSRWIILITAYSRHGFHKETLDLFYEMQRQGLRPNEYILCSVIRACANTSNLKAGEQIHLIVLHYSIDSDAFIGTALINLYSKCGRFDNVCRVFDRMLVKDLVAWNAIVSGYALHGFSKIALGLFGKMRLMGLRPDLITWNAMIAGFAQVGDVAMSLNLFEMMLGDGIEPDVVSWTSVISGFVQNFHNEEAFDMFRRMMGSRVWPSSVTISGLLPACSNVADSRHGQEIHGYALVIGVEEDVFVSSSLIDMYAKCGFIFEAAKLFGKMHERNTVSWNSMIFGYANHGFCDKAIELFYEMVRKENVKPDHLTFTAVFTACCHAGMVEVGQKLFNSMQEEYGIEARLEHYACIVDLLGRAGKVTEAYDLVKTMHVEPDSFVWGALLGACRHHRNVELAKVAASHLFELEPGSAGSSVLLSNVFADAGRYEDAARLKKMVKRKKLIRSLGCSWMEAT
ncbi:pentatricopeptide repeat-containing protein At5g59600-like [Magnolia sinica]|uniref:pentatricopeptide repeat-containing protein At5g59600-like n=1 Tax=Magnolia sinica TaxID=86752 RepID=UPI00265A192C|nr:pentatricopeptide repeat-containing protein At5g59600-like [Magnolia sinica]